MELKTIAENLIQGHAKKVKELTKTALQEGHSAKEVLDKGLIAGMEVVGVKFKNNEFFLPEVLVAARAMHEGMSILEPLLAKSRVKPKGKFAIGTVKGDLHDIGKNLVIMMMKGAGFETIDLGVDVPADKFVQVIKEKDIQILGMSALLTTTMLNMKSVMEAINRAGVRDKVKIMVGGAPVTEKWASEINADGYAPDAATAVEKAKKLLKK